MFLDIPNGVLDAIESELFGNCRECCERMVAKWLDVDVTASWKKLKNAVNFAVLKPSNRKGMQLHLCSYVLAIFYVTTSNMGSCICSDNS